VRTTAGESVGFGGAETDPSVRFPGADEVQVSAIWIRSGDGPELDRVLGLRLDAPGAEVVRWRSFQLAYGTDSAMGAVASEAAHRRLDEASWDDVLDRLLEDQLVDLDLDGTGGDDVVVFSNGFGDGGFPMSEGVDAEGRTVSLVIWNTIHPWRLAIPDGVPPPDVTRAED